MQNLLNECLLLAREIDNKRQLITELETKLLYPKSQQLSDMPKGGNPINTTDESLDKIAEIQELVNCLTSRLKTKWATVDVKTKSMQNSIKDMLKYRFFYGYPWGICTKKLQKKYPNEQWNDNKCFRVYRNIINKN